MFVRVCVCVCVCVFATSVVAVLLNEFITNVEQSKQQSKFETDAADEEALDSSHLRTVASPLDPLLETLSFFTTNEDLVTRIRDLYDRIDLDESGTVDISELNAGFKRMSMRAPISLSIEDYELITEHGRYTDNGDEMSPEAFESMIMAQLRRFARRKLMDAMQKAQEHEQMSFDQLFAMKMILSTVDHLQMALEGGHRGSCAHANLRSNVVFKCFTLQVDDYFAEWRRMVKEARGPGVTQTASPRQSGSRRAGGAEETEEAGRGTSLARMTLDVDGCISSDYRRSANGAVGSVHDFKELQGVGPGSDVLSAVGDIQSKRTREQDMEREQRRGQRTLEDIHALLLVQNNMFKTFETRLSFIESRGNGLIRRQPAGSRTVEGSTPPMSPRRIKPMSPRRMKSKSVQPSSSRSKVDLILTCSHSGATVLDSVLKTPRQRSGEMTPERAETPLEELMARYSTVDNQTGSGSD